MSGHAEREPAGMREKLEEAPEAWVEAAALLPRIHAGDSEVIARAERDPDFRRSAIIVTRKAVESAESDSQRETLEGMLAKLEAL